MTLVKLCGGLAFCWCAASGQTVSFEVVSVKPAEPLNRQRVLAGQQQLGKKMDLARVEYASVTLGSLISEAYNIKTYQVAGPDFLQGNGAPRFDIQAKMPEGASAAQIPRMLQSLLSDRFDMKYHKETRERGIYELTVAKSGLKIKPSGAPPAPDGEEASQGMQLSGSMEGKGLTVTGSPLGGGTTHVSMSPDGQGIRLEMGSVPMGHLAELLSRLVDRPVLDSTGLKGDYQVALDLPEAALVAMAGLGSPPRFDAGNGESAAMIFQAIERLGLKLGSRKGRVETFVIDHIERAPAKN